MEIEIDGKSSWSSLQTAPMVRTFSSEGGGSPAGGADAGPALIGIHGQPARYARRNLPTCTSSPSSSGSSDSMRRRLT